MLSHKHPDDYKYVRSPVSRWFVRSDPAVVDYRIDHTHGLVVESLSGDPHIDDDVAIGSHRVHSAPAFVRLRLAVRDLVRTNGVRHVDGERPRRSARGRDGQHFLGTALCRSDRW